MDLDEYLKKIGCLDAKKPLCLENLAKIRRGHTNTFCFENLDMHMGKPIKFSIEDSYNRLVKESRGGYCIQLNFVLGWALQQLGYELNFHIITIYSKGFDHVYSRWPVHAAIVVKLDDGKLYFVDGGTTRFLYEPIEIEMNKIQKSLFGTFRFVPHESSHHGCIRLQRSKNAADESGLEFENQLWFKLDDPKVFEDFREMNEYVQTEKHPMIYYRSLCQLHRGNKIIMLVGWKYSEITFDECGETRVDRTIESIDEVHDILANKFNLIIDKSFRPVDNKPLV